jgi:Ca-activated chloride channel family protein
LQKRGQMQIGKMFGSCGATLTVLLALAGGTNTLDGQVHQTSEATITAIHRLWPEVNLNVLVLDKSGAPKKIDEQAFQLFADRAARPLRFPTAADSPASVALLIDSSGSIYKRKADIVSAVAAIIKALPADSEVMAVDFSYIAYIDLPLTPVSKVDFSFLDRLQPNGHTALLDAVIATEDYLGGNARYARRALVILSDGEDNASANLTGAVPPGILLPGAPTIYACRVQDPRRTLNDLTESARGHKMLALLAHMGGGLALNLDPDPVAAAAQIVADIRSQHVLQFTDADPARYGRERKLEVKLPVKDVQIHVSPAYYAPPE